MMGPSGDSMPPGTAGLYGAGKSINEALLHGHMSMSLAGGQQSTTAGWLDLSGSWNLFRRAGDLLHLGGTLFLLLSILLYEVSQVGTFTLFLLYFLNKVFNYYSLFKNIK